MASSATSVAPFQGLKSTAGLPVSRHSTNSGFGNVSNGGRIKCMQVYMIYTSSGFSFKVKDQINSCYEIQINLI